MILEVAILDVISGRENEFESRLEHNDLSESQEKM